MTAAHFVALDFEGLRGFPYHTYIFFSFLFQLRDGSTTAARIRRQWAETDKNREHK